MNFTPKFTSVSELRVSGRKKMPRIIRATVALIGLLVKLIVSGWSSKPDAQGRPGTNACRPRPRTHKRLPGKKRLAELRMENTKQEAEHNRYKLVEEKSPAMEKEQP